MYLESSNLIIWTLDYPYCFSKLVSELSDFQQHQMDVDEAKSDRKLLAYKHTSLKPYIEVFERFIDNLLADQKAWAGFYSPQQILHTSLFQIAYGSGKKE